jgi:hypothetical protein
LIAALGLRPFLATIAGGRPMNSPTTPQATMKTVFHADLSDAHAGEDDWVQACGRRYPLIAHTEQTRAAAKVASPILAALADHHLTHYTREPADLPADRVVRVHIKHTLRNQPNAKGNAGLGNVAIHVPPRLPATGWLPPTTSLRPGLPSTCGTRCLP